MARSLDDRLTQSILEAAVDLIGESSFAAVSMGAIASRAGVGKPALYRRFANKAELVAAAVAAVLPPMTVDVARCGGDPREELRMLLHRALPSDPPAYAALIGGLMAEHRRHPEMIEAFRATVLLPRRAIIENAVARAQRAGRLRGELTPESAVDMLGGAFMARAFAGLPMDEDWLAHLFESWWLLARA